jgi:hypothetical protein
LEQFSESMTYALGAGKLFDVTQETEYVETLIGELFQTWHNLSINLHSNIDT